MTREDLKIYYFLIKVIDKILSGKYLVKCKFYSYLLDKTDYTFLLNVKDKCIDLYYYDFSYSLDYSEYNKSWWLEKNKNRFFYDY